MSLRGIGIVNPACPVNWAHPLNRGLRCWLRAIPNSGWRGALKWHDLVRGGRRANDGTLTAGPAWTGPRGRPGGHGAILFDGTDDLVSLANGAFISAPPFTLMCFFNAANATGNHCLVAICSSSSNNPLYTLSARGDVGGDPIQTQHRNDAASATGVANTSTGYTAGIWGHASGIFASTSSRRALRDGGSGATDTTSVTTTTVDRTSVGCLNRLTPASFAAAAVDDVRFYTRAVSDAETNAYIKEARAGNLNTINWLEKPSPHWLAEAAAAGRPWAYRHLNRQNAGMVA
jgi:hypothetical protein